MFDGTNIYINKEWTLVHIQKIMNHDLIKLNPLIHINKKNNIGIIVLTGLRIDKSIYNIIYDISVKKYII